MIEAFSLWLISTALVILLFSEISSWPVLSEADRAHQRALIKKHKIVPTWLSIVWFVCVIGFAMVLR